VPWITVGLLIAAASLAEQKPACNKSNHGRFWPEAANSSAEARRTAARDGSLEMCSYGIWKYRWEPLTVNVQRLADARKVPAPAFVNTTNEPKR
jgi:hypothetical protein